MSDDSLGMAVLEHSGESTIPYESDIDRAPARVLPLRGTGRRGASASGDGSDVRRLKFTKERKVKECGTPRGREHSQVKLLENRLRKVEQEKLATTCEAAASLSSVVHQAEAKVATIEASALEQSNALHRLAINAEREAGVRECTAVRQMQEQLTARTGNAEHAVAELRSQVCGGAADKVRREATLMSEMNTHVEAGLQRETALKAEINAMRGEVASTLQRETALKAEMIAMRGEVASTLQRETALKAEMNAMRGEVAGTLQRELMMKSEFEQMRRELLQVKTEQGHDKMSAHDEMNKVTEQLRKQYQEERMQWEASARAEREHERMAARDEINRVTEQLRKQYQEERLQWESSARLRGGPSQPPDEPPGLPSKTTSAYMSASGVLTRGVASPGGSPPGPPPGASIGMALDEKNNDAVKLMCGGSAPPPPPPPPPASGGSCGAPEQFGGYRQQRWVLGNDDGGAEQDGLHIGTGVQLRRSEAATITIAPIPVPSQFRSWRINTLREIAAASLMPDRCYAWVLRTESEEDVNDPSPFNSIDGKVISALNKVLSGELLRQVQTVIEADSRGGKFTSGRTMLRCVLRHFATSSEHGQLYDLSDLLQIRLSGGTAQALESFATSWSWVEQGLRQDVPNELKASLLWEQLKEFTPLQPELLPYRISAPGDSVHTYAYLRGVMNKHAERTKQERTRAQVVAGLASMGGGQMKAYAATDASDSANPGEKAFRSNVCYQWQRGECRKGAKCRFTHPEAEKGSKPRSNSNTRRNSPKGSTRRNSPRGGTNPRGSSPSSASDSSVGNKCLSFQKTGTCRFGDRCKYTHASPESAYKSEQPSHMHEPRSDQSSSSMQSNSIMCDRGEVRIACESDNCSSCAHVCLREHRDICSYASTVDTITWRKWIVDSGAGVDLIGKQHVSDHEHDSTTSCSKPVKLSTANGRTTVDQRVQCEVENLNVVLCPYVLESCPPVLSLGKRVIHDGFDFVWKASDPQHPKLISPNGEVTLLSVERCVPMLIEQPEENVAVATAWEPRIAEGLPAGPTEGDESESEPLVEGGVDRHDMQQIASERGDSEIDIHDDVDMDPPNMTKSDFLRNGKRQDAATSRMHLLTHYPKNKFCKCCQKTKAVSAPARRIRPGNEKVPVEAFGQVIHIDHLVAGENCKGREGEKVALIVIDQHTSFGYAYPATSKSSDEVVAGIRHFLGDKVDWRNVAVKSDNSMEIKSAVKQLGLAHYVSTPYRHQANGLVERFIRRLVESTRASLSQACLPIEFWTHGIRHAAMCYNLFVPVVETGDTPWIRRMGEECEWDAVHAFGSRVHAMIHGGSGKNNKFEPSATESVLLSWFCAPGFVWKDNEVMTVSQGLAIENGCEAHIHRTREVTGEASYVFPFVEQKFGQGRRDVGDGADSSCYPFRQVSLDEADDRTLKVVGEGLDSAKHEGALSRNMLEKGWRIDKFGDRLVKTPPNSSRPPFLTPEDWRSIPLAARRAIAAPNKSEDKEKERREDKKENGASSSDAGCRSDAATETAADAIAAAPLLQCHAEVFDDKNVHGNKTRKKAIWFAGDDVSRQGGKNLPLNDSTARICEELCMGGDFQHVCIEVCCETDSVLGNRSRSNVIHIRITEEQDVCSPSCQDIINRICERLKGKVFVWCSPPCTTGCAWHRTRPELVKSESHQRKVKEHRKIAEACLKIVRIAQTHGSRFAWKWPQSNDLWKSPVGLEIGQCSGACERIVDGCSVNMRGTEHHMKKPWRIISNDDGVLNVLTGLKCLGRHTHEQCRGKKAVRSGRYTNMFADLVMSGIHGRSQGEQRSLIRNRSVHLCLNAEFDPVSRERSHVSDRRQCWASAANAIRNALNSNRGRVCDMHVEEGEWGIDEACDRLQQMICQVNVPLACTRTNIFEKEGGRIRGLHFWIATVTRQGDFG